VKPLSAERLGRRGSFTNGWEELGLFDKDCKQIPTNIRPMRPD